MNGPGRGAYRRSRSRACLHAVGSDQLSRLWARSQGTQAVFLALSVPWDLGPKILHARRIQSGWIAQIAAARNSNAQPSSPLTILRG